MKYFKVFYKQGKKKSFTIIPAHNKIEAIDNFYNLEIGVLRKLQEVKKPLSVSFKEYQDKFDNPIKNKPADLENLIAILDQLAVMIDAGLPLNFVLAESVKAQDDKMLEAIFSNILSDIESGQGFYSAASNYRVQLGYLTLSMIKLGEETGRLAESLTHLSSILQDILDNRKKFKKATRYPITILVAMSIAFTVVTIFVIPQFRSFFEQTKMELPLPTRFLLWLEDALTTYGPYILVGAFAISFMIGYAYSHNEKVKYTLDKWILKIMIIGKATFFAMISRFVYVFEILVKAGIPMIEALKIASEIVDNSYIKQRIDLISSSIEEGRSLHQGFEDTKLFENMVIEMIKAGEAGGGLDKMLSKVSKIYKSRFDYLVDNIATLIEPILIAAIAGFVLTLALGIFLPMWNMVDLTN